MGYIANHTIVVEGWSESKELKKAHKLAKKVCSSVSPITKSVTNGSCAFFVAPDGSKEGWDDSQRGDEARNTLIDFLRETDLDWVEVRFGGDDPAQARIQRCNGWDK